MKKLNNILSDIQILETRGQEVEMVRELQLDSRACQEGDMFIAIKGTLTDGHEYISKAIEKGASIIVCEAFPEKLVETCYYILVKDASYSCGHLASNYFEHPSKSLKLVGVTGTNGKSSCVTLLYQLFTSLGFVSGLLSTIENKIGQETIPSTHTTPNPIELQRLLAQMRDAGCEYAFMEVSSHAVHQHRIAGAHFAGALFTNISHDHLDYHKTFDEYISVKKKFFDDLPSTAFAISNIDDKRGGVMLQNTKATKHTISLKTIASFKAKIIENNLNGLILNIDQQEVHVKLVGAFNAYNILSVYAVAQCLGLDKTESLQYISNLTGAEGRFETLRSNKENILGIIDYAHTPDALINVLATINSVRTGQETLHAIIGCGGDRDKTKRPIMALVACEHADKIIFTSDNPRSEKVEAILSDMEEGVPAPLKKKYVCISNRKEAIKSVCSAAVKGDIILIAGKGHEKYQEIDGVKYDFDDKEILNDFFELMEK